MLARRLVRRLIVPAAYTAVLVLLVTGLWPHISPRLAAVAPAATPMPRPTSGSVQAGGAAAGLQGAIASVRRFTGDPTLALEGGLRTEGGGRGATYYYLETAQPEPGEDVFKVDAQTAEVIEATLRSRLASTTASAEISAEEAERTAERYARGHFLGFEQLTLVDRATRANEEIPVHSFKWSQVAPSGAELPTSVSVAVSGGSGDVVWYLAQRDPVQVDIQPTVSRERAIETARGWVGGRDQRWDTSSPLAVRLQVLYDDDDRQQLVWSVSFRGRAEAERPSIRLLVDAHNGQILAPSS